MTYKPPQTHSIVCNLLYIFCELQVTVSVVETLVNMNNWLVQDKVDTWYSYMGINEQFKEPSMSAIWNAMLRLCMGDQTGNII